MHRTYTTGGPTSNKGSSSIPQSPGRSKDEEDGPERKRSLKRVGTPDSIGSVKYNLNPGMMKGPNAPLLPVDLLMHEVQPETWNNIPLPVIDAIKRIIECCVEFKKLNFEIYNDGINVQRVINLNQGQAFRDCQYLKEELIENAALLEHRIDKHLTDQEAKFKAMLQENHDTLEGKMREYIEKKVEEQSLILKSWSA